MLDRIPEEWGFVRPKKRGLDLLKRVVVRSASRGAHPDKERRKN